MNPVDEKVKQLTEEATKQGKIIELGWLALRAVSIPPNASELQLREMRNSFFAGAQHLFASILTILDPDSEPTQKDLNRMSLIHSELEAFAEQFRIKNKLGGERDPTTLS